jgi:glycosyltransferase involved in cell wall biosynthesis
MKILFLSTRPDKPSFRFRVERLLPSFTQRGHECDVRFLSGSSVARLLSYRECGGYDGVFLQKRLLNPAELWVLRRFARRLVYDFDDAVMYSAQGQPRCGSRRRFEAMCQAADLVIPGNGYLQKLADAAGARTLLIPTCIDTDAYHPRLRPRAASSDLVTIGWTGSRSTNRYLGALFPVLARLAGRIERQILSDTENDFDYERLGDVPHRFTPWSREVEIPFVAGLDIGLMPLTDDLWTRGKCGFKALQYMGLAVAAVCSPVGVNREIIADGENGLLADTPNEWHAALTRLIDNPSLRQRLAAAGRQTIEQRYSLATQGPRLVDALERLIHAAPTAAARAA